MRDNQLFFGVAGEKGESNSDCANKVLDIIQTNKEVENASKTVKLQRAQEGIAQKMIEHLRYDIYEDKKKL